MKYGSVSLGQIEAAINKLGGQEVWDAWLRGEKTVTIEDVIQLLFDKHGRRIHEGLKSNVRDADRNFRLDQPKLDGEVSFANRILQLHESLGINTGISGAQLQQEGERLKDLIMKIPGVSSVLNGVCLPVVLMKRHSNDIGEDMEWQLNGVEKSYCKTFNNRKFHNHRKDTLAGQVKIIKESGYQVVWDRKENEHVVALFFPNPLQGYSILAQREQMTTLPKGFVLSGAIEPMLMYPDVLARDWNTPGLDLSAFSWLSSGCSLCFGARDGGLLFGRAGSLSHANDYYSGSLLFLG